VPAAGAALARIGEEAEGAVRGAGDLAPYAPGSPYTFTVEFATASSAASVMFFPQLQRVGDRRVTWAHDDYETAFKMFIGVMRMATSDPDYG